MKIKQFKIDFNITNTIENYNDHCIINIFSISGGYEVLIALFILIKSKIHIVST